MLKTAEELKIKGLAEVSWRSDQEQQNPSLNETADESHISKKRKLDTTTPITTANIKKEFTEKQVIVVRLKLIYYYYSFLLILLGK